MKRLLAALLTLSMLVGIVPFSAFAESPGTVPETFAAAQESPGLDDETVQSIVSDPLLQGQYAPPQQTQPTVDTSNMSMEATDSFGKLLMNSIDEQNSASSSENRVIGVTVDGSTATVEYVAAEDADIVVALYTDDSEELMSASGTAPAFVTEDNTGSSTATVSLTGSIPNSFVVKAFLLDTVEHAPLSNEFTSNAYTKDMQDLKNATVDDYPADRVVNLDENDDTNFAVVKDDVVLVNEDDTSTGAMSVIDNGDGSYTIYNADEKTRNMQPGEIFVYQCDEGILVVQVETIDVSGSTVVISGDDALDLVDVFDIVKIEVADDGSQLEYDGTGVDEEVEYRGKVKEDSSLEETNALDDVDLSTSIAMKFVIGSDTFYDGEKTDIKDDTHITSKFGINAVLNLKLTTTFTYYAAFSSHNFTFSTDSEISGGVEISYAEDIKIDLGYFKKEFPGVYINYTPQFVFKGNVKGTFNYKLTSKQGITCENRQFHDISEEPVTEFSIKITGTVYIGLEFAPSIKIGVYKLFKPHTEENFNALASLTLTLAAGIEGTITADIPTETVTPNRITSTYYGSSVHECRECLAGTLHAKIKITIDVKIIKVWSTTATPVDITGHDFSVYYSHDYNEVNIGKCPHKLYLVNISINTDILPDDTEVFMSTKDVEKQSIGTLVGTTNNYCYMEPGTYTLKSWANGFFFSSEFTLTTSDTDVTLLASADGNFSGGGGDSGGGGGGGIIGGGETIASGTCGNNLKWELDSDGVLTISGTGAMTNYTGSYNDDTKESTIDSPWFDRRLDIQKIRIKNGVTSIGDYAFAWCSNVTSVSVPDSVTRIGQGCFAQCSSLTDIVLPNNVTSIPMGSFTGCSSLVSISYSSKLESIGLMAFEDCVNLRSIDLPYGLTSIGYAAFMDCHSLTSITLPESLSGLGGFMGEVFANCTSLTSVTFPRSFTSTGFGTFGGCTSLVDVTIPDTITTIGASTFSDCTSLTNITLPSSITAIGEDAFSGCTSLTSFVIPNGVPSIGEDTFRNCYALTAITIPASVTTIGYAAFEYCYNLSSVNYAGTPAQWKQIDIDSGNTALEQAYEGNPISSCGDNATWSIDNAGTLTIRGTGEITDTPWSDPMILPYSIHIKNVVLEDGITGICSYAFDYTDIVSVTLPATLIHIDYSAFDGCNDLTTVNYAGSPEQWNNIKIANHNDELLNATRYYYSSNASTVFSEENSIFPSTATGDDHSFAASFSDLTPGVSYAVIVSRSEIDPLAPENLIYINQFRASSSDYQQSFQTKRSSTVTENDMFYVVAAGSRVFEDTSVNPGGGSSSGGGGGGGGGGGAAVLIGVGAAAAITAGVIMMSPVEIKGRVVLADQAAVPGAKISLLREGKVVAQTTADENGSFSLKAKRGSYELTAAYTNADGQLIYKTIDIKAPAKDLTVTF